MLGFTVLRFYPSESLCFLFQHCFGPAFLFSLKGLGTPASVEPLLKILSISCSFLLILRCLCATCCMSFTGHSCTYPRGEIVAVVAAGRSISNFLQLKSWIAVSTLRSYIWREAAGVLGVAIASCGLITIIALAL